MIERSLLKKYAPLSFWFLRRSYYSRFLFLVRDWWPHYPGETWQNAFEVAHKLACRPGQLQIECYSKMITEKAVGLA